MHDQESNLESLKPLSDIELQCCIGDHETHELEDGELDESLDLHSSYTICAKNPTHEQFIPIERFTIDHLPEAHRDKDLFDFIRAAADLTVRVDVKSVSPYRPKYYPKTKVPYLFYSSRESTPLRRGSGTIRRIYRYVDGVNQIEDKQRNNYTRCWCTECLHSASPSRTWWEFKVDTAAHVVFDDIEAGRTSLRLFFDGDDSHVVVVDKVVVYDINVERDRCKLKCVTCDKNLAEKLVEIRKRFVDVWKNIFTKNKLSRDVDKLTFIVSHPHGCSKQVSIGIWREKFQMGEDENKFTYTTCTCPGSSGATVHLVGYSGFWYYQLVHSGCLNSKLNYSSVGFVYLLLKH